MQGLLFLFCGEVFEAETVIVAAGYESRYITRTVGIDIPMTRYFEEALVTEMQPHMIDVMFGCASADFRYWRRIPLLADAKIVRTWGGWLDDSYDGVSVISKIDEMDASDFKNLFENLYNYEK